MSNQNDPTVQASAHHARMCKLDAHGEAGIPILIRGDFGDDATGDVVVQRECPCRLRIIGAWIENTGANTAVANTIQVCAAAAGASGITEAMSLNGVADKTLVRAAVIDDASSIIAKGGDIYLRQTKAGGAMGGTVWIEAVPLTILI